MFYVRSYNTNVHIKERNFGIDLLRILATYLVVVLHICNQGGLVEFVSSIEQYSIISFYKSISCVSVNLFCLITGYVNYKENSSFDIVRYIYLYLQVVITCLSISLLCYFIVPEYSSISIILKSFFPITLNHYWYFSAYTGLYFLMPVLNKSINSLTKENSIMYVFGLLTMSLYITFSNIVGDPFTLKYGYSLLWLIILYVLGAVIKKYNLFNNLSNLRISFIFMTCLIINTFLMCLCYYLYTSMNISFFENLSEYFIGYTSITVLISSISLLLLFSRISIINRNSKNIISILSSLSFGVYIIHTNPIIWKNIFKNFFVFLLDYNIWIFIEIPFYALIVYLICSCFDLLRYYLFKILNVKDILIKIFSEFLIRKSKK